MVITEQGLLIRTGVDSIPQTGRIAKGVRVVRLGQGDRVISATVVSNGDDEENGDTPDPASETAPDAPDAPAAPEASEAPDAAGAPEANP
jgi:DNA gyrase subunit A